MQNMYYGICNVTGCQHKVKRQTEQITYHRLPNKYRKQWIAAISPHEDLQEDQVSKHYTVCSLHFRPECFNEDHCRKRQFCLDNNLPLPHKRRVLNEGAVPTIFPDGVKMVTKQQQDHQQQLQQQQQQQEEEQQQQNQQQQLHQQPQQQQEDRQQQQQRQFDDLLKHAVLKSLGYVKEPMEQQRQKQQQQCEADIDLEKMKQFINETDIIYEFEEDTNDQSNIDLVLEQSSSHHKKFVHASFTEVKSNQVKIPINCAEIPVDRPSPSKEEKFTRCLRVMSWRHCFERKVILDTLATINAYYENRKRELYQKERNLQIKHNAEVRQNNAEIRRTNALREILELKKALSDREQSKLNDMEKIRDMEIGKELKKKTQKAKKEYKCGECIATFIHMGQFNNHKRIKHNTGEKLHLKHSGEKPYKCHLCEFSCTKRNHLHVHVQRHEGFRPHKCPHCDAAFLLTGNLKRHMRLHTGEKPYKCTLCDYSGKQSSSLQLHMLMHTGEKPFKCNYLGCEYSCRQASRLKRHMRRHTGEKPYKCTRCDFVTSFRSSLKKHEIRSHVKCEPE